MPWFRRMPDGASLRHPAGFIATLGGIGLIRIAPGTWGSLAALPPAAAIVWLWGPAGLAVAVVLATVIGIWAADYACRQEPDSSSVVVDEAAGQWLALVPVAFDPWLYPIAFLLFRVLDITKPWPASRIDRRTRSGFGVMLDDLVAGAYAGGLTVLIAHLIGWESCFLIRSSTSPAP